MTFPNLNFQDFLHPRPKPTGLDVQFSYGYYACHGVVDHSEKLANDDNHEDDIWALLTQSYQSSQQHSYEQLLGQYLQLWQNFWSKMDTLTT